VSYVFPERTVEAVRFDGENAAAVEAFTGPGVIEWDESTPGRFAVVTPEGRAAGVVGTWVVQIGAGFYSMNPKVFTALQAAP
jgi:hypothetical protein